MPLTTFRKTKNRALSTVASGLDNTTDPVTFAVADGSVFPSTFPFFITVENEILRCTAKASNDLTVDRAQEGTAAASHANGVAVELRVTAGMIDAITAAVNALEDGQGDSVQTQEITAVGNTIDSSTRTVYLNNTSAGAIDLTSNPQIEAGVKEGQRLTIMVISADTVQIDDGDGCNLSTANFIMGQYDTLELLWHVASATWVEKARSNN